MFNIAVLISGGGTNLQALIDANKEDKWQIKLVVSDKQNAFGLKRAVSANIKTLFISKYEPVKLLDSLKENDIDGIVLAGYLSILPHEIIKVYEGKIINIHPSLIPAFCGKGFYGAKVHSAVLESGVKVTGATAHFVDTGIDTGPIILQKTVPVLDGDTVDSLQKRVLQTEHEILVEAVRILIGADYETKSID